MVLRAPRRSAARRPEEGPEAASYPEEAKVALARPEASMMYYLLIKRSPRGVFPWSTIFVGTDMVEAKKNIVEIIFGTGFPNTDDELLERYNVDVVELTDDWEKKLNDLSEELQA